MKGQCKVDTVEVGVEMEAEVGRRGVEGAVGLWGTRHRVGTNTVVRNPGQSCDGAALCKLSCGTGTCQYFIFMFCVQVPSYHSSSVCDDWIHERIDQSIHIGSRGLI